MLKKTPAEAGAGRCERLDGRGVFCRSLSILFLGQAMVPAQPIMGVFPMKLGPAFIPRNGRLRVKMLGSSA